MGIDAIIAGGGIAGLACAWRLHAAGKGVLVLEVDARAGGHVRTQRVDGYRLESGPHTFMGSADAVFALAAEVGLAGEIIPTMPAARTRYIARHGAIHAIPTGPVSFLTSKLLSFKGKLALAGEPLRTRRGDPTDTAQQFFERRFGPEAARVLAGAFISGVYAGDPARLSAPAAFPLFWRFEQESGGMIRGMVGHLKRRRAEREARGEIRPGAAGGCSLSARGSGSSAQGWRRSSATACSPGLPCARSGGPAPAMWSAPGRASSRAPGWWWPSRPRRRGGSSGGWIPSSDCRSGGSPWRPSRWSTWATRRARERYRTGSDSWLRGAKGCAAWACSSPPAALRRPRAGGRGPSRRVRRRGPGSRRARSRRRGAARRRAGRPREPRRPGHAALLRAD